MHPTQVNFLLPTDTNATTVQVQIKNPAGITAQMPLTVQNNALQLLTADGKYVSGAHANGDVLGKVGLLAPTPTTPAAPGETVVLYCTGGGPTNPPLIPGQMPTEALSLATLPQVTIGGAPATVVSAAVVPGNPGVYQLKVQVPPGAANGDQPVIVQSGAFASASTLITVQK